MLPCPHALLAAQNRWIYGHKAAHSAAAAIANRQAHHERRNHGSGHVQFGKPLATLLLLHWLALPEMAFPALSQTCGVEEGPWRFVEAVLSFGDDFWRGRLSCSDVSHLGRVRVKVRARSGAVRIEANKSQAGGGSGDIQRAPTKQPPSQTLRNLAPCSAQLSCSVPTVWIFSPTYTQPSAREPHDSARSSPWQGLAQRVPRHTVGAEAGAVQAPRCSQAGAVQASYCNQACRWPMQRRTTVVHPSCLVTRRVESKGTMLTLPSLPVFTPGNNHMPAPLSFALRLFK
eukprot:166629-Chlamydomonas_euryale.AAC.4